MFHKTIVMTAARNGNIAKAFLLSGQARATTRMAATRSSEVNITWNTSQGSRKAGRPAEAPYANVKIKEQRG